MQVVNPLLFTSPQQHNKKVLKPLSPLPFSPKPYKLVQDLMQNYFKMNKGFNVKLTESTGYFSNVNISNSGQNFSSAVNLRNGRVLLVPYEYNAIVLFNMQDGTIVERKIENVFDEGRYINAHLLYKSTVILIPADSNTPPVLYDVSTGEYLLLKPLVLNQLHGNVKFHDIFSHSTLIGGKNLLGENNSGNGIITLKDAHKSANILLLNKNTNKPYIFNYITNEWTGINNTGTFCSIGEGTTGTICATKEQFPYGEMIVCTNRIDVSTNKSFVQMFYIPTLIDQLENGLETNLSGGCRTILQTGVDEYVGCISSEYNVYFIPFKSQVLKKINLKTMEVSEWTIPMDMLNENSLEVGVSKSGCWLPNGNLFISPYGMSYGLEFDEKKGKFFKTGLASMSEGSSAMIAGCLLMNNGLVFGLPGKRKSGVIFGTESNSDTPDVFVNSYYNTSY